MFDFSMASKIQNCDIEKGYELLNTIVQMYRVHMKHAQNNNEHNAS